MALAPIIVMIASPIALAYFDAPYWSYVLATMILIVHQTIESKDE